MLNNKIWVLKYSHESPLNGHCFSDSPEDCMWIWSTSFHTANFILVLLNRSFFQSLSLLKIDFKSIKTIKTVPHEKGEDYLAKWCRINHLLKVIQPTWRHTCCPLKGSYYLDSKELTIEMLGIKLITLLKSSTCATYRKGIFNIRNNGALLFIVLKS